jgi:outer membrane protein assembly factor BamB
VACGSSRTAVRQKLLRRSAAILAVGLIAVFATTSGAEDRTARVGGNWLRFGYDSARGNAGPTRTGITAGNVRRLVLRRVPVDGTIDSSPIYLRDALVKRHRHDVFIATTSYGKVLAIDADSSRLLWRFTPPNYTSWAGTYRLTTSSPAVDRRRQFVYSAAPNGFVYKLRIATGVAVRSSGWPVRITKSPAFEKISSPLNITAKVLLAATASFHDVGAYQGHVVVVDLRSGRVIRVWNALCGDTPRLLAPPSCGLSGAGIWARAGVVVQPGTGDLLVATGNGVWDGRTAWSNSVIVLSPDGRRRIGGWTPSDWPALASADLDVGSTAPALLAKWVAVQGGKDGKLRLLDLRLVERKGPAGIVGRELQIVSGPGGALFSAPAVWRSAGKTWLFVATSSRVAGYTFTRGRLVLRWNGSFPGPTLGTSPVVAGGLLYLNNVANRTLDVYRPTTGKLIVSLPAGHGHWNSPIVTDGRIALGEGDANEQLTTGALDVYSFARSH